MLLVFVVFEHSVSCSSYGCYVTVAVNYINACLNTLFLVLLMAVM